MRTSATVIVRGTLFALLAITAVVAALGVSGSSGSDSQSLSDEPVGSWDADDSVIRLDDAAACLRAHGARVALSPRPSARELRVELPRASPLTLRFFASAAAAAAAGGPHTHNVGYRTPDGATSPAHFEVMGLCLA